MTEQTQAALRAPSLAARGSHLGTSTRRCSCCRPSTVGRRDLAQLAAVCDDNLLGRLPTLGAKGFNFLHNVHAIFDMAKHHMFAIQPMTTGESGEQKPRAVQCQPTHGLLLMGLLSKTAILKERTPKSWKHSSKPGIKPR